MSLFNFRLMMHDRCTVLDYTLFEHEADSVDDLCASRIRPGRTVSSPHKRSVVWNNSLDCLSEAQTGPRQDCSNHYNLQPSHEWLDFI